MDKLTPQTHWTDPRWREKSDGPWRAGLRLQQAWWRAQQLELPAGPRKSSDDRLVTSMLPLGVTLERNVMTPEARASVEQARADLVGRSGMIEPDRLLRNLLSSQPLCFNLFGYLSAYPEALLPWVAEIDARAASVRSARLEWAPASGRLGGSAFDAFVEYDQVDGARCFIGVECKYAENLSESQRDPAAQKYIDATETSEAWVSGASSALNKTGLRQFWYNQLLGQRVLEDGFDHGCVVVVACEADAAAKAAVRAVNSLLRDPGTLRFWSIEHLVEMVIGHDDWRDGFSQRYTDFSPIQDQLPKDDPRRT